MNMLYIFTANKKYHEALFIQNNFDCFNIYRNSSNQLKDCQYQKWTAMKKDFPLKDFFSFLLFSPYFFHIIKKVSDKDNLSKYKKLSNKQSVY